MQDTPLYASLPCRYGSFCPTLKFWPEHSADHMVGVLHETWHKTRPYGNSLCGGHGQCAGGQGRPLSTFPMFNRHSGPCIVASCSRGTSLKQRRESTVRDWMICGPTLKHPSSDERAFGPMTNNINDLNELPFMPASSIVCTDCSNVYSQLRV